MSTFNGFVSEFPSIRIDCFRTLPGRSPPLACFLSHVHSDHLVGLESLKSPFVYCSPATREILLRLEKYPHRMNFSTGILECRKQTYRHLKTLLKPIPLETPTRIELSPGNDIQVTLFDANHCVGAVSFLVEGQGKAILYTGDIRSEEWWINTLTRHPKIVPYTSPRKRLDKIYLDTTFAVKDDPYRHFPSKLSGLQEILAKLDKYPETTSFYFQAWTFGYEDVWLALSQALNSPVHLDRYRYSIYNSISHNPGLESREAPVLCGFKCGNTQHPGILTKDARVRLHSCERGTGCQVFDGTQDVVTITPIISRHAGVEIRELGAGGGQGDLDQIHELDLSDPLAVNHLLSLCVTNIKDPVVLHKITDLLSASLTAEKGRLQLDLPEDDDEANPFDQDAIPLDQVPKLIADLALGHRTATHPKSRQRLHDIKAPLQTPSYPPLPISITFPYSRHSSYTELRLLVAALRPRDVWPCTVPPEEAWHEDMSMEALFGDLCEMKGAEFAFDAEMRAKMAEGRKRKRGGRMGEEGSDGDGDDGDEGKLQQRPWEVGIDGNGARRVNQAIIANRKVDDVSETESEDEGGGGPGHGVGVATNAIPEVLEVDIMDRDRVRRAVSPPSTAERLRVRAAAFEAARTGKWHEVGLVSVSASGVEAEGDEEL